MSSEGITRQTAFGTRIGFRKKFWHLVESCARAKRRSRAAGTFERTLQVIANG
jgi:hypothetical protein